VRVFARHGFDGGTIRQIAREAGVAEGLIYHYFENKHALLDAVARESSLLSWLERAEALPQDLPMERALVHAVHEAMTRNMANPELLAIIMGRTCTDHDTRQRVGQLVREIQERVAGYFERKAAEGEVRDVDAHVLARILGGSVLFFAVSQTQLSPPLRYLDPGKFARTLVDVLLHGIKPRAQLPEPSQEGRDEIDADITE